MADGSAWLQGLYQGSSPEELAAGRAALMGGSVGSAIPKLYARASGSKFWTDDGSEYIDCTSQAWSLGVGACHAFVMQAIKAQLDYFTHVRTNFDTVPKLLLSKKLAEIGPGDLKRVTYSLHGTTAVEGAMKLAMRNRPGRKYFVTFWDGYSGRSLATIDMTYPHPTPFLNYTGNKLRVPQPYCYRCPYGMTYPSCKLFCVDMIGKLIENSLDGQPVALLMEPLQASGGMIPFPKPAYEAIRQLCVKYDMLLIWDEIQTGFGRLGEMFGADLYGVVPDILIFGKALGGGFPLAGSLQSERLKGFEPGDHSFTFGHFPPSMVAGLATLKVMEDEGHLANCRKMGTFITARLLELKDRYEIIGDVRGPGLMIGIELVRDRKTRERATNEAVRFVEEGFRRGVLFGHSKYAGLGNVVKIKPPLVITEAEAERVVQVFEEVTEVMSRPASRAQR
jgi:4-aminobutyrate aminotransferase-like enzyme